MSRMIRITIYPVPTFEKMAASGSSHNNDRRQDPNTTSTVHREPTFPIHHEDLTDDESDRIC